MFQVRAVGSCTTDYSCDLAGTKPGEVKMVKNEGGIIEAHQVNISSVQYLQVVSQAHTHTRSGTMLPVLGKKLAMLLMQLDKGASSCTKARSTTTSSMWISKTEYLL